MGESVVYIYVVNISDNSFAIEMDRQIHLLPASFIKESKAYLDANDKKRYLASRLLLYSGLIQLGYNSDILTYYRSTSAGKPYLDVPDAPDFSLTHAGNYCIVALSGNGAIGIDLEEIRKLEWKEQKSVLTHKEAGLIKHDPDSLKLFFEVWTRKEALFKALGAESLDFVMPLSVMGNSNITVFGTRWFFKQIDLDENFVCTLVSDRHLEAKDLSIERNLISFG